MHFLLESVYTKIWFDETSQSFAVIYKTHHNCKAMVSFHYILVFLYLSTGCSPQLDLALVIDSSGSIRAERFRNVTNYMKTVVSNLNVGPDATRVSVVSFSDTASVEFNLNSYTAKEDVMHVSLILLSFQKVCRIHFFSWMSEHNVTFYSQTLTGCPDHCKFCFCWRLFETV